MAAVRWKHDIDAKVFLPSGAKIPVLLLGNKVGSAAPCLRCARSAVGAGLLTASPVRLRCAFLSFWLQCDLLDEGHTPCIPTAALDNFLSENAFYAHFLCSAKTGANVKEACTHLVAKIHSNNQSEMTSQADADSGDGGGGGKAADAQSQAAIKLTEAANAPEPKAGCC